MRRVKRDRTERAYQRGYQAGSRGRSRDLCPFSDLENRHSWLSGWRNGREDQWDGLTGINGLARVTV